MCKDILKYSLNQIKGVMENENLPNEIKEYVIIFNHIRRDVFIKILYVYTTDDDSFFPIFIQLTDTENIQKNVMLITFPTALFNLADRK